MTRVRFALALASVLLPCGVARASDLLVNGQADAAVAQGLPVTVTITGTPGALAWLLVDESPGPTQAVGQLLPVGPNPVILLLGAIPGGGTLALGTTVPFDIGLIDQTVYMVGAVADAPQPSQWDWSEGATLHVLDRNMQLAGNALPIYPSFEFVRAFNGNAPVTVGVDPTLHPEVVGVTADVYVTAAKTRAGWLANNVLVDVSGGAEAFLFTNTTLAQNEVVVAAGGSLFADAGYGLGVGYDVVVDLNGNGLWDGNDLIDGFADESGLYAVHDITQPGPLAVTEVKYSGGFQLAQDLYYPTDIANLPGLRPLVTVSHGNGHDYQWYDHIGLHLASYGFIVMSHFNNTGPGIESASVTTITNNEYLLGNLATIAGGALVGHIDTNNIMWIGHSRGGEGIARAYDKLIDGTTVPVNFSADDIKLLSSIAPTDFLLTDFANPHGANFHLWVGGADSDVTGCASSNVVQSYHLHDRAQGRRLSVELHGVGHGDFHAGGGNPWATGPCLVGTTDTHTVMRGLLLPLAMSHLEGNIPAEDFLWRQWEHFRPIGAPVLNPCVVVDLMYRRGASEGKFVLDDFQTNPSMAVSSSGGAIATSLTIVGEGRLDDEDTSFLWDGDIFNGFTGAMTTDTSRGLVIEFPGGADTFLSFSLPAGAQDVSDWDYLSFRAAQATRHPLTTALLADTIFTVELSDADGATSQLNISAYGGGIEEPYQRTSCGAGVGWGNEFEVIRIRLSDFTHGGNGLDLSQLAAVTFRFGPSFSAPAAGRLGLDDLEFTGE